MHRCPVRLAVLLAVALIVCMGCGSEAVRGKAGVPNHTRADLSFIVGMGYFYERDVQIARIAAERGADRRVRDLGELIVARQSPELEQLKRWASRTFYTANIDLRMPAGYVDLATEERLLRQTGLVFDRDVLLTLASSQAGGVELARRYLADGPVFRPAQILAGSIQAAGIIQGSQIRQLAASVR